MVGSTEVIDNSEKCRRREEKRKKDDKEKFNKWEKEKVRVINCYRS